MMPVAERIRRIPPLRKECKKRWNKPLEKCLTVGRGFVKITSKSKIFDIHINRWALGKKLMICWERR